MGILNIVKAGAPGASATLNSTIGKVGDLKSAALAQFENPLAEASALKGELLGKVAGLKGKLSSMIPALPEIPNLNAQAAFAGLKDIDIGSVAGIANLDTLKTSFGDTLDVGGIDIDSVVSQVQGGVDIGGLIPNLELGLDGIPFELPANISFSSVSGLKELLPEIPKFDITIDNDTLTGLIDTAKLAVQEASDAVGDLDKFSIDVDSTLGSIVDSATDSVDDTIKKYTVVKETLTLT